MTRQPPYIDPEDDEPRLPVVGVVLLLVLIEVLLVVGLWIVW